MYVLSVVGKSPVLQKTDFLRKRLRRQKLEKVRKEDKREKVISRLLTAGSDLRC